jgi:S-adenosylmethionine:tRNA ribosyltransferase-isomerase
MPCPVCLEQERSRMRVDLFDYHLPDQLIAVEPMKRREDARMMYLPEAGGLQDGYVEDLAQLVEPGDIWILNNTRVIPAQLSGQRPKDALPEGTEGARDAAQVGVTLHKQVGGAEGQWLAFVRPAKRLRVGDSIFFAADFHAKVLEKREDGQILLDFAQPMESLLQQLKKYGRMPLPPYMKREGTKQDEQDYQTIFARHDGSVAAPTASFHLTDALMEDMRKAGATFAEVTLHVGGGTFLPVKVDDTNEHVMHSEWCELSPEVAALINKAREEGRRIVAVGTTALRTLESFAAADGKVYAGAKETDIFITPGYDFRIVDALMTNFHLPRSTLLMLVCAFMGRTRMMDAYKHAIAEQYRFFSYGDASFLERWRG